MNRRNFLSAILSSIGSIVLAPVIRVLAPVARTMYDPRLSELGSMHNVRIVMTAGYAGGKTAKTVASSVIYLVHPSAYDDLRDGHWHEVQVENIVSTVKIEEEAHVSRLIE